MTKIQILEELLYLQLIYCHFHHCCVNATRRSTGFPIATLKHSYYKFGELHSQPAESILISSVTYTKYTPTVISSILYLKKPISIKQFFIKISCCKSSTPRYLNSLIDFNNSPPLSNIECKSIKSQK